MECKKQFIPTVCNKIDCPFFNGCAMLQTEVVKTRDDEQIDLMFIGQGCGQKEHLTHHPFTGPAGKLLREKLLPRLESKKLNIILDNTIRSRPLDEKGKNRAPTKEEVEHCLPIVWQRIRQYNPTVIIPVGGSSAGDLIPAVYRKPISSVRGRKYIVNNFLFIPTFHPAAILHCKIPEVAQEYHNKIEQDIDFAIAETGGKIRLI